MYNYLEHEVEDIKDWIITNDVDIPKEDTEELKETLYDDLWIEDSVTGNGSGAYFSTEDEAKKAVADNLDLLGEALKEFGCSWDIMKQGVHYADVTMRCYLLAQAVDQAVDELMERR